MLEVLSRINDVDLFIYTYLIKTWIMASLSALAWAITVLSVYKAAKHNNSQELEKLRGQKEVGSSCALAVHINFS
jgi:hypothetical protein